MQDKETEFRTARKFIISAHAGYEYYWIAYRIPWEALNFASRWFQASYNKYTSANRAEENAYLEHEYVWITVFEEF